MECHHYYHYMYYIGIGIILRVTLIVQKICMESEEFIMNLNAGEYNSSLWDHRISILEVVNNFGEHGLLNPSVRRHK